LRTWFEVDPIVSTATESPESQMPMDMVVVDSFASHAPIASSHDIPDVPCPPSERQGHSPSSSSRRLPSDPLEDRFCRIKGCTKLFKTKKDCHRHREIHFPSRYLCPNPNCPQVGKWGVRGVFPRSDSLTRHWRTRCSQFAMSADKVEAMCSSERHWCESTLDPYDPVVHVAPAKNSQEKWKADV
jgi:hypothetical protein